MASSKRDFYKVWIFLAVLSTGLWSLTSCQKQKKPSFIIVAIDQLSFNSFSCEDEKSVSSGLDFLCAEGIRFTHAYTTSTQPAAAMGSLLTGVYPAQHQLHRSFDRLASNLPMLQEKATQLGYHTSFFSGSPSILRKTNLTLGFDVFDDSTFLEKKTYFLDFKTQTERFFAVTQDRSSPLFSIIHNSELESLNEGASEISSFEKLDEKLHQFFTQLKERNMWDQNYIIVLGLRGQSDLTRINETPFSNLHSENTMVSLFVKPPRVKGDEGVSRKIDIPVNVADLGLSLAKTLNGSDKNFSLTANRFQTEFPLIDFSSIWLNKVQNFTDSPRRLLIESVDTWNSEVAVRFAVLFKNLVYIENEKPAVYNSLTDLLESIDVSKSQQGFAGNNALLLADIRARENLKIWSSFQSKWHPWVDLNREYWSKPNSRNFLFKTELERLMKEKQTQPLSALMLRHYVQNKRTTELKPIKFKSLATRSLIPIEKQREAIFENAKLHSLNLALENIWGLWDPEKEWVYSDLIFESQ